MNSKTFAGRICRVAMIGILVGWVAPAPGVFAGESFAGQLDDNPGARVFGVTVGGDGSALPGVLISLSGGKVKQRTVSGTDGEFSFASVPPGDYVVVFQFQGKKKLKREVPVATEDVDLGTILVD